MAERNAGLSSGVGRLWEPAQQRTAREALSVPRIVRAAVELADAEGLDAVSMARVAERLGAGTMSLYRHVAGKDELLLLMHDSVWREPQAAGLPDLSAGWRPALEAWCHEQRVTYAAHPWLERIRFVERAGTPSQVVALERGLAVLAGTALSEPDKVSVLMLLNGYLLWMARYDEELRTATTALHVDLAQVAGQFGALMGSLTAQGRFPHLAQAVAAHAFEPGTITVGDFDWGLARILDGVDRLMRAPTPPD